MYNNFQGSHYKYVVYIVLFFQISIVNLKKQNNFRKGTLLKIFSYF